MQDKIIDMRDQSICLIWTRATPVDKDEAQSMQIWFVHLNGYGR